MKTIRIGFSDYWEGFDPADNYLTDLLRERYDVQICDDPDYLFYTCFGVRHTLFNGIKIFFTGEDVSPDFNMCDYAIGFDEIEFGDRYLRHPNFVHRNTYEAAKSKHEITDEEIAGKTKFCNFVYSNPNASPVRRQFFEKLSQYKPVDSGGRYLNNIGGGVGDKIGFQSGYKFSIAFENDRSDGYTTEKLIDAFAAKTVPIYWGNPHVAKDFNEKAFINCNNYASFAEVIERVKEVDNDDEQFCAMLSAPIFASESVAEELSMDRLRLFLFAIFDQPIEKASRRSRFSWQKYYIEDWQNIVGKVLRRSDSRWWSVPRAVYYRAKKVLNKFHK